MLFEIYQTLFKMLVLTFKLFNDDFFRIYYYYLGCKNSNVSIKLLLFKTLFFPQIYDYLLLYLLFLILEII